MKICILIIYSPDPYYEDMLEIQRNYLLKFDNITYYFIQMKPDLSLDFEVNDDIIYVKGEESMMNILHKTVVSMKYILKNHSFDFMLRTNISTLVNIKELSSFLEMVPQKGYYGSGNFQQLWWEAMSDGPFDESLLGTWFSQGTSILFSPDLVQDICENSDKLRYSVIDDVAIGSYIKTYHPEILNVSFKYIPLFILSEYINFENEIPDHYVFYRNRQNAFSNDRTIDVLRMCSISNKLLDNLECSRTT